MIKNILMFRTNDASFGQFNFVVDFMAAEYERLGCHVDFVDIMSEHFGEELIDKLEHNRIDAAFSFNCIGEAEVRFSDGENVYDHFGVPFVEFIGDHPMDHFKHIIKSGKLFYLTFVDRDHISFIKECCSNVKDAVFIPHCGMQRARKKCDYSYEEYAARKYSLAMIGNHLDRSKTEQELTEMPALQRRLAFETIDYLLDNRNESLDNAFHKVFNDNGLGEIHGTEYGMLCQQFLKVPLYVRSYVREEVVRYICASGLEFDIFGGGWSSLSSDELGNARVHPAVPFEEVAEIYADSQMVLNVNAWFKNGTHERVSAAMINGAAALTDHSIYLDELFLTDERDKEALFMYDISNPQDVPYMIDELLSDKERLYEASVRGRKFAEENYSVSVMAKKYLEAADSMIHGDRVGSL